MINAMNRTRLQLGSRCRYDQLLKETVLNRKEFVAKGYELFSVDKPTVFQDIDPGDPESLDHNRLLVEKDRNTLALDDIGNVGYNPIVQINPEGMVYYFPRLVDFALDIEQVNSWQEPYLFLFVLNTVEGPTDTRYSLFTQEQKNYVKMVLKFIETNFMAFVEKDCFEDDLREALDAWDVR